MSHTDTVKKAYEMFHAGDVAGMKDLFADDAVWHSSDEVPLGGALHGSDAIIDMMTRIPEYWTSVILEPNTYLEAGERVVALGTQRFTNAQGTAETPFAQVLEFDGAGKVVRSDLFGDTAKIARLQT
ncbi:nuclear transport factor 2 family protein [Mycolicibacillus trivialis]